jgi:hypothetical protein
VLILKRFKLFRMNTSTSVDSKEVMGTGCLQESNWVRQVDSEGVRRTAWRAGMAGRAGKNLPDPTTQL